MTKIKRITDKKLEKEFNAYLLTVFKENQNRPYYKVLMEQKPRYKVDLEFMNILHKEQNKYIKLLENRLLKQRS